MDKEELGLQRLGSRALSATLDEIQPYQIALKSRVILEKRAQASSQHLCGTEKPDSAHVIHQLRVRDTHRNMQRG
jgi:hypothetical protein